MPLSSPSSSQSSPRSSKPPSRSSKSSSRSNNKTTSTEPSDPMRGVVLVLTVFFALAAGAIRWSVGQGNASNALWMVSAVGMTRLALVLGALWIAWPTVRRPVMWLPPGLAAVAVVAIGACVVHPRLAIALFPLVGALIALAGFVRFFRGH